jgi:hypothetical protein
MHITHAQFKQFYIKDKQTNEPLAYASILLIKENKVLYSDSIGKLFLEEKVIQQNDSIKIGFINYKDIIITGKSLSNSSQILLERSFHQLKDIVVGLCEQYEIYKITEKYGRIKHHNGAGFNAPTKLLGYYANNTGKEGWLSQLEFHASGVKQPDAKIRIRWYEWDDKNQLPGKDLTDTNIIVSVRKNGWNTINIPDKTIYIDEKGIVLGFDMIYSSSIIKTFKEIIDTIESRKFRFQYNWLLGIDLTTKKEGFVLYKDTELRGMNFFADKQYHKPAIHLYIKTCAK